MGDSSFDFIIDKLSTLSLKNIYSLQSLEQEIALLLNHAPENVSGLIALAKVECMLGHRHRAQSAVNKVWELGSHLNNRLEFYYVETLLNLGQIEMASQILKDRFINLSDNVSLFGVLLIKFAIITGNINLLERILAYHFDAMLKDFVAVYKVKDYAEHFKNIQKLVLEETRDSLCGYDYTFYNDRGFVDLEIILSLDGADKDKVWHNINNRIDFYHLSNKTKRLHNLGFLTVNAAES